MFLLCDKDVSIWSNNELENLDEIKKALLDRFEKQYEIHIEKYCLVNLSHPNIIKFNKAFQDKKHLFFVLEYGDIQEKILGTKDLSKKYFEDWFEIDSEGHSYTWKIEQFKKGLREYFENMKEWKPYKQEYPFQP